MENSHHAGSLFELLAKVPDPRGQKGRRHPLPAMLTAIICAILTGARGYRTIAQWTTSQGPKVWEWLGFRRKPPCANTFRNLLLVLEPEVLEVVLLQWMASILDRPALEDILPEDLQQSDIQAVAIDGKTLRNTTAHNTTALCDTLTAHQRNVQLLSLLDQATGGVLSQQEISPTTNEHKTAVDLLKTIALKGRLVTGDAMFCQRDLCEQIVDSGGHYLVVVKDNQPELKAAIAADFQPGLSPHYREATANVAF